MSISVQAYSVVAGEKRKVAVKIMGAAAAASVRRSFHFALLLDVSGSMEGSRINAVRRTLHLLIDALQDNDKISLISYNSSATCLTFGHVVNAEARVALHAMVDGLVADGGTNIESAITLLGSRYNECPVDSVFLLTDGHINVGIRTATGLLRVATTLMPTGIPINTLGYGSAHNSLMLRDMATHTRGSYTYADTDELLPAIIGDIVGGLASEVARNASLAFNGEGWKCLEMGTVEGDTNYFVGMLIADKPQWVVLEGPVTAEFPTLTLSYSIDGIRSTTTVATPIDVVGDDAVMVAEQCDRAYAAQAFARVTDAIARGEVEVAREALTELENRLTASAAAARPLVLQLRAQLDEMRAALTTARHGAPSVTRLMSNTCALGMQRGFFTTPAASTGLSTIPLTNTFSSPSQQGATVVLTARFTQTTMDTDDTGMPTRRPTLS